MAVVMRLENVGLSDNQKHKIEQENAKAIFMEKKKANIENIFILTIITIILHLTKIVTFDPKNSHIQRGKM